jgi:hypothetical protein
MTDQSDLLPMMMPTSAGLRSALWVWVLLAIVAVRFLGGIIGG